MIGRTIDHYRIEKKLGEGGMGVVFLAEDISLERKVALKFLPESLREDDQALRRFLREAKSAGGLDHPYICKVFEVSQTPEGQDFIVLEYLQGKTLQAELAESGPIPLKKAVHLASEIAEALESAHNSGIVHRDLKPANIMLTEQGHVKVMDFGLAKRVIASDATKADITEGLTKAGTMLGTLSYMSPEQLKGEILDHRTDIFSFGVVFFEMLTGTHPFRKSQPMQTANAILSEEISRSDSKLKEYSYFLQHIVRKTLAKEKERRYQLIHEVQTDLTALLEDNFAVAGETGRAELRVPAPMGTTKSFLPWILTSVLAIMTLVVLLLWGPWSDSQTLQAPPARYTLNLTPNQALSFDEASGVAIAISPDGKNLAYTVTENNTSRIYLRRMDEFGAQPLIGTEGASTPFFSPDGEWIAFSSGNRLYKLSLNGGAPQTIAAIESHCNGGSWGADDTIVFGDCLVGLKRVSAAGGEAELISELNWGPLEQLERDHRVPQILPGGKAILFCLDNSTEDKRVAVRFLETGIQKTVLKRGAHPRYVPTGHIVYAWEGDLFAVPFDLATLEVTGSPVSVLQGILMEEIHGVANFTFSENGTLVYVSGPLITGKASLALSDLEGAVETLPISGGEGYFSPRSPRLSPDGKQVLLSRQDELGRVHLWLYELGRGPWRRLTEGEEDEWWAIWSHDGAGVIYNSTLQGNPLAHLFRKSFNTVAPELLIPQAKFHQQPGSISRDGSLLFYQESETPTGIDIWELNLSEGRHPEKLLGSPAHEIHPAISPDSRWLAYASDESGNWEVYVQPYPALSGRIQVSINGGWEPLWDPKGKTIYYRDTSRGSVFSVEFEPEPVPRVGRPQKLVEGIFVEGLRYGRDYDLAGDGSRFLLLTAGPERAGPTEIRVVQNWFEELKRLVDAGQ